MSICSSTRRAWSRSRLPASHTLLPFLYQTATILQCTAATRHGTRRHFQSRSDGSNDIPFQSHSNGDDDIPFQDGPLPPAIEREPVRPTTITDTERKAFRKLYLTATRQEQEKSHANRGLGRDEIADEDYEEDGEPAVSLDKVFDDVLKGKPALQARASTHRPPPKQPGQDAQPAKEDTDEIQSTSPDKAAVLQIKQLRTAALQRFTQLLSSAKTDLELWHILETQAFAPIRLLELDGTSKTKSQGDATAPPHATPLKLKTKSSTSKSEAKLTEQRTLFLNFPYYLIHAVTTLRDSFPTSPLPLSILPAIKALGRSSYALGATTALYKHLIRTAWIQQSSYFTIDALLTDMHNSAVEFDAEILALLDSIIKEHNTALSGVFGREMLMVYGMEMFVEGVDKVKMWRDVVARRLAPVENKPPALGQALEMESKYSGPRYVALRPWVGKPIRRGDDREKPEWRSIPLARGPTSPP